MTDQLLLIVSGILLILVLMGSAILDALYHRIPNVITFSAICILLLGHFIIGSWVGLLFSFEGLVFGFLSLLIPYILGGMGAGDVKLMMAVGAALGFRHTLISCIFIAICGGLLSVFYMIKRGVLKKSFAKISAALLLLIGHADGSLLKYNKEDIVQEGIPFGVAICGGVMLFFAYMVYSGNGVELLNPYLYR